MKTDNPKDKAMLTAIIVNAMRNDPKVREMGGSVKLLARYLNAWSIGVGHRRIRNLSHEGKSLLSPEQLS